ncbi:LCP family protein [Salirhabdus salicampi]|uniref:LCP family protein n=1 Tax=Salirhabdus salicampi TaxID=476102 RepID=UPI0020C57BF9|nr:LCP family protein [Salirhabdus salicampi]MCP8615569.1 LCP family protein [Salirhabdus salicampi]
MTQRRLLRKRRRRKQRRNFTILFFCLFVIGTISYSLYEYYAGKSSASDHKSEEQQKQSEEYEDEFQGETDITGKTNVLILGVDSRDEEKARTDTIMIGQYDTEQETAKIVSIMRDTYVYIPGYGYNKINSAFFHGGPELLRQTLKANFDINVEYYAIVDFQGFIQVVDTIAPKGIEIDVEKYMSENLDVELFPGLQRLNGKELLDYARFRQDHENDFGRVRRQQQVIGALKDEFLSIAGVMKLPRVVGTIQPYVDTNMKTTKILSIGKEFVLNPVGDIESLRIPIDGTFWDETYEHAGAVLAINEEENRKALQQFLNEDE